MYDQTPQIAPTPQPRQPETPPPIDDFIEKRRAYYGIPRNLVKSLTETESGGQQTNASGGVKTSSQNARGRFQVLPGTAKQYGLDANNEYDNAEAGLRYLSDLNKKVHTDVKDPGERWAATIAGYHSGGGGLNEVNRTGNLPNRRDANMSTTDYTKRVFDRWRQLDTGEQGQQSTPQPQPAKPLPRRPSKTQPNVFNQQPQTPPAVRNAFSVNPAGAMAQTMADVNAINRATPVDPKLRAQSEAYHEQNPVSQAATDVYQGMARGGQQMQEAGQRAIGAGAKLARRYVYPNAPNTPIDIRSEQGRAAQEQTAQNLEAQKRASGDPLLGEVASAVPVAAGAVLAGSAGGPVGLAAYNAGLEDWKDPKRSALRVAANTLIPVGAAKVAGRLAAPAISRIASPAVRATANIGTEAASGGLVNAGQTAAEQQYYDGRVDPNAVLRSGVVGAGMGGAIAAGHGAPAGAIPIESRTRPGEVAARPIIRESDHLPNRTENPLAFNQAEDAAPKQTQIVNLPAAMGPKGEPMSPAAMRPVATPRSRTPMQDALRGATGRKIQYGATAELARPDEAAPTPAASERSTGENIIRTKQARAEQMIQDGDHAGAISELQGLQRAIKDEITASRGQQGKRSQLQTMAGNVGNRIGEVRQMARQAAKIENAPTAEIASPQEISLDDQHKVARANLRDIQRKHGGMPGAEKMIAEARQKVSDLSNQISIRDAHAKRDADQQGYGNRRTPKPAVGEAVQSEIPSTEAPNLPQSKFAGSTWKDSAIRRADELRARGTEHGAAFEQAQQELTNAGHEMAHQVQHDDVIEDASGGQYLIQVTSKGQVALHGLDDNGQPNDLYEPIYDPVRQTRNGTESEKYHNGGTSILAESRVVRRAGSLKSEPTVDFTELVAEAPSVTQEPGKTLREAARRDVAGKNETPLKDWNTADLAQREGQSLSDYYENKPESAQKYYHGSSVSGLTEIKPQQGHVALGDYGEGVHFTNSPDQAKEYSQGRKNRVARVLGDTTSEPQNGSVYEINPNLQKPLIINTEAEYDQYNELGKRDLSEGDRERSDGDTAVARYARASGYDGVINNLSGEHVAFTSRPIKVTSRPESAPLPNSISERERMVARRSQERESALKGNFGKFSEAARKSNEGARTPLASHPELRQLLDLPPIPDRATDAAGHDAEMQHTLNALAELGDKPRSSELDYDTLKGVYKRVALKAAHRGTPISDDLRNSFKGTVADLLKSQDSFGRFATEVAVQEALIHLDNTYGEQREPTRRESAALKAGIVAAAKQHGIAPTFADKWWKAAKDEAARRAESRSSRSSAEGDARGDRPDGSVGLRPDREAVPERATGTHGAEIAAQPPVEPIQPNSRAGRGRAEQRDAVQEETPVGRKIQHSQFGEIRESANQEGVAKGKLRVTDTEGVDHEIQHPRTRGNQNAAFVKDQGAKANAETIALNWKSDTRGGFGAEHEGHQVAILPYGKGRYEAFFGDRELGVFPTEDAAKVGVSAFIKQHGQGLLPGTMDKVRKYIGRDRNWQESESTDDLQSALKTIQEIPAQKSAASEADIALAKRLIEGELNKRDVKTKTPEWKTGDKVSVNVNGRTFTAIVEAEHGYGLSDELTPNAAVIIRTERGRQMEVTRRQISPYQGGEKATPEQAKRQRARFSVGALENEPKGPIAPSGLGVFQDKFGRKKSTPESDVEMPPLTGDLRRSAPPVTKGLGAIRMEQMGEQREVPKPDRPIRSVRDIRMEDMGTPAAEGAKPTERAARKPRVSLTASEYAAEKLKGNPLERDESAFSRAVTTEAHKAIDDAVAQKQRGRMKDDHYQRIVDAAEKLITAGRAGDRRAANEARNDLRAAVLNRGIVKKIARAPIEALKASQTLVFGTDVSYPLRQAFLLTVPPSQWGRVARASKASWQSLWSEKGAEGVRARLEAHPDRALADKYNVELANSGAQEEVYKHSFISKTPIIKHLVGRAEAANEAYIDSLRLDTFGGLAKRVTNNKELNSRQIDDGYKAAAELTNWYSGRVNLGEGKIKAAADALNGTIMTAPRLNISRAQLMNPFKYAEIYKGNRAVGNQMMSMIGQSAAVFGGLLALAHASGAKVGTNPDDPDFGKVVWGNHHYELTGGTLAHVKMAYRLAHFFGNTGKTLYDPSNKNVADLKKESGKLGRGTETFIRGRFSPSASLVYDTLKQSDITGAPVTPREFRQLWGNPVWRMYTTLSLKDFYDGYKDSGVAGALKTTPGVFGAGVSVYDPTKKKTTSRPSTPRRPVRDRFAP